MSDYETAAGYLVVAIGLAGFFTLIVIGAVLLFLYWPRKYDK